MSPEVEAELRTTVASLRVKTSCQEILILILALLPSLEPHQKSALRDRLDAMEGGEVVASRLIEADRVESETAIWVQTMREALDG
jgi:hypothetical protein